MDQTFGHYNNPVPPQGQGQQWDFSALLDSGNSGPFTETHDHYGVDETHMANMGNFNRPANLASFFNQQTPNFVVPGQESSSAFETWSAMGGENLLMRQRQVDMQSCVSWNNCSL